MKRITKKDRIAQASAAVDREIASRTDPRSISSRGLSREGYLGGYSAALDDVILMMNGVPPCRNPEFWKEEP